MLNDKAVKVFAQAITADTSGTVNGENTKIQLDGNAGESCAFGKTRTVGGGSDSFTKVYLETSHTGLDDDWIVAQNFNATGVAGTQDVTGAVNLLKYVRVRVDIGGTAYTSCYVQVWIGSTRHIASV